MSVLRFNTYGTWKEIGSPYIPQPPASVTSLANLFRYIPWITEDSIRGIGGWDMSSVRNMSNMFTGVSALTTITLLDTPSVTNMANMFDGASSLTEVTLLDTSSVTTMAFMFRNATSLASIEIGDTSSVTNMSYMFNGASALSTVTLPNTSSVTNMSFMFRLATSLTSIEIGDASKVTSISNAFDGVPNLERLILNGLKIGGFTVALHNMTLANILEFIDHLGTASGTTAQTTLTLSVPSDKQADVTSSAEYIAAENRGWTFVITT